MLLILLGVLLAAACSSPPPTSAPPAGTAAAPSAPVTAIPAGTYRNAIVPSGPQSLVIGAGSSYTQVMTSTGQSIQGTLGQDAQQRVTFTSVAGAPCAGQVGTYKASVDGTTLHLTAVADPCQSRASAFVSGPWTS
ncbi:hypothetical protein LQ327_19645 [Actinomycetospora endophytica]|uniref:Uncharacterized protein n=1 Tax=Actinomycetospora endophytica TaxID=2291215 RepID=A0ABS8PBE5_9PSEU|nr:hypothetical protein [Actinomycetospora endophytica]MCD2195587.1 hypothetical protein [Actinomycetospora endophytica]